MVSRLLVYLNVNRQYASNLIKTISGFLQVMENIENHANLLWVMESRRK